MPRWLRRVPDKGARRPRPVPISGGERIGRRRMDWTSGLTPIPARSQRRSDVSRRKHPRGRLSLPWPAPDGRLRSVGCLLALLALISPRLVLVVLWIFSDVLSRAFDSWIIPLLGFFLLPWTTLTYAAFWDWGSGRHVTGVEWFFVILAFLIDLGSYAQGRQAQSARTAG